MATIWSALGQGQNGNDLMSTNTKDLIQGVMGMMRGRETANQNAQEEAARNMIGMNRDRMTQTNNAYEQGQSYLGSESERLRALYAAAQARLSDMQKRGEKAGTPEFDTEQANLGHYRNTIERSEAERGNIFRAYMNSPYGGNGTLPVQQPTYTDPSPVVGPPNAQQNTYGNVPRPGYDDIMQRLSEIYK